MTPNLLTHLLPWAGVEGTQHPYPLCLRVNTSCIAVNTSLLHTQAGIELTLKRMKGSGVEKCKRSRKKKQPNKASWAIPPWLLLAGEKTSGYSPCNTSHQEGSHSEKNLCKLSLQVSCSFPQITSLIIYATDLRTQQFCVKKFDLPLWFQYPTNTFLKFLLVLSEIQQ